MFVFTTLQVIPRVNHMASSSSNSGSSSSSEDSDDRRKRQKREKKEKKERKVTSKPCKCSSEAIGEACMPSAAFSSDMPAPFDRRRRKAKIRRRTKTGRSTNTKASTSTTRSVMAARHWLRRRMMSRRVAASAPIAWALRQRDPASAPPPRRVHRFLSFLRAFRCVLGEVRHPAGRRHVHEAGGVFCMALRSQGRAAGCLRPAGDQGVLLRLL